MLAVSVQRARCSMAGTENWPLQFVVELRASWQVDTRGAQCTIPTKRCLFECSTRPTRAAPTTLATDATAQGLSAMGTNVCRSNSSKVKFDRKAGIEWHDVKYVNSLASMR